MRQVRELERDGAAVRVDGDRVVVPLTAPDGFGAAPFDLGAITT